MQFQYASKRSSKTVVFIRISDPDALPSSYQVLPCRNVSPSIGYSSCKQLGRFPVQCNCREPLPSSLDKLVRFVGQHRFHCGLLDSSTEGPMEGGVREGEGKTVGGGGGSGSDASESRGGSRNGLYVSRTMAQRVHGNLTSLPASTKPP
ncbi:hypothetical protein V1478_003083 [Vespula squamosa]|uniref:Uncharacterized protein n=1 Tax=Vespula squamosa TaxID=30214 RepID=A0ABD2BRN6_VESSQ